MEPAVSDCVAVAVDDGVLVPDDDALRVDEPLPVSVGEELGESDVDCVSACAHSRSKHSSSYV